MRQKLCQRGPEDPIDLDVRIMLDIAISWGDIAKYLPKSGTVVARTSEEPGKGPRTNRLLRGVKSHVF